MVGDGMRDDWHYEMQHYDILGLPNTATIDDVKKKYRRLVLFAHTDRVRDRNGTITPEDYTRWNDIVASYTVLTNDLWKDIYDRNIQLVNNFFQCSGCNLQNNWRINGHISRKSYHVFCSEACADNWEPTKNYTDTTHNYPQKDWTPPPPPPKPKRTCPGCEKERDFDDPNKWVRLTSTDTDYCCSYPCLAKFLYEKGTPYAKCEFCDLIKTDKNTGGDWTRKNVGEKKLLFCSDDHYFAYTNRGSGGLGTGNGDPLQADRDAAIAEIDNFLKTPPEVLNSELEAGNQNWRNDIQNAAGLPQIKAIKDRVLADIKAKRDAKGGDPLLTHKNKAIDEIDTELLNDPEITTAELEAGNQNWGTDIQNAKSETEINQIKDRILADIRKKRQAKQGDGGGGGGGPSGPNLSELRAAAINQIKQELAKNPPVAENELSNQNWETEINQAGDKNAIENICGRILAEIKNKREVKAEKGKLAELLAKAKKPENWNNYANLENILNQIKELRSSSAYSEKETEIKAIESRLQELDPSKYKETVKKSLDKQVKDNGLEEKDLDKETQKAIEEAKNDPTNSEKRSKAEEGIAVCGANKDLNNILVKVKKVTTKKDKEDLINEILTFISKNSFTDKVYQKRKSEIEAILAELRGEKKQNTSPDKKPFPWVVVSLCVIAVLIGGIVVFLVLRKRKQRLKAKIKKENKTED